ncbi:MAG: fibrobacter succinogenes major paralogous domain-containing protein [Bacteroidales bacterium]
MKMPFQIIPLLITGLVLMSVSGCKKDQDNLQPGTVKDTDGNTYKIVEIGDQWWMAENLKTTRYNDGTLIPNQPDDTLWVDLTTGAYCWYDNNYNNLGSVYGALYNWFAVSTGKLCPQGWHVPTDEEWTKIISYLGELTVAGGKLKTTGTFEGGTGLWRDPNTDATNESGFLGLPGGRRDNYGNFGHVGYYGDWWSSTAGSTTTAWSRELGYNYSNVYKGSSNKGLGFSVRCVKD